MRKLALAFPAIALLAACGPQQDPATDEALFGAAIGGAIGAGASDDDNRVAATILGAGAGAAAGTAISRRAEGGGCYITSRQTGETVRGPCQ